MSLWFLLHSQLCLFPLRVTCIENMTRSENKMELPFPSNQTEVVGGPSKEATGVLLFVNIAVSFFVGGFLLPKLYAKCRQTERPIHHEVSSTREQFRNDMENGTGANQGV